MRAAANSSARSTPHGVERVDELRALVLVERQLDAVEARVGQRLDRGAGLVQLLDA